MIADLEERYDETRQLQALRFGAGVVAVKEGSQYRRSAHLACCSGADFFEPAGLELRSLEVLGSLPRRFPEESSQYHGSQDGNRSSMSSTAAVQDSLH